MSRSFETTIDDRIFIEENHSASTKIKPIGAERKIGQKLVKNLSNSLNDQQNEIRPSSINSSALFSPRFVDSSNQFDIRDRSTSSICRTAKSNEINREFFENLPTTNNFRTFFPARWISQPLLIRRSLPLTNFARFSAPFHFQRERFQVNSIGRPILRTQLFGCPLRR